LAVTVQNPLGAVTAVSAASSPVGGGGGTTVSPPSNSTPPTVSGTPQDGQTLSVFAGSWSGSPASYAYQWQRCDATGAACADLTGATTSSYQVVAADVDNTLRVIVTATNSGGTASAGSAVTARVTAAPAPPVSTTQTLTFSGSINQKSSARVFGITVGAGVTHAQLSFSKCTGLNLMLGSGSGTIDQASGPSVLAMDETLAAGGYAYTVSGSGRCSFTLSITSAAP
jgi:hypothetical protein